MRRASIPLILTAVMGITLSGSITPVRAAGTTFLVNTLQDDATNPPAGSLRQALLDAQAGDTIEFVQGLVITLDDHLLVDTYVDDLTIRGPVTLASPGGKARRELSVSANRVTIEDVVFDDVQLLTNRLAPGTSSFIGPDDLTVTGCTFHQSGRLVLQSGMRARVSGNTFFYDHFPPDTVLQVSTTRDAVIEDNEVHPASTGDRAFSDTYSTGITVRGNLLGGSAFLQSNSGEFSGNQVLGDSGMLVYYSDYAFDRGPLLIDDNDFRTLQVFRTDVAITGNRVGVGVGTTAGKKGDIRLAVNSFDPKGGMGTVEIRGNTVENGTVGIQLLHSKKASAPAVIADNQVTGSSFLGINAVLPPGDAAVTGNTLTLCGGTAGRKTGAAMSLVPPAGDGILELSMNLVQGGGADGIVCIQKGKNPGVVVSSLNGVDSVSGTGFLFLGKVLEVSSTNDRAAHCGGAGVSIDRGVLMTAADLEATGCGGPGVVCGKKSSLDALYASATGNAGPGFLFLKKSVGNVVASTVEGNGGAGVLLEAKATASVQNTTTAGNGGPGIDLFPAGFSDNGVKKKANDNLPYPEDMEVEAGTGQLVGTTAPGALVEVYETESGEGGHGGAVELVGSVFADGSGQFRYPESGKLDCPDSGYVTVTATLFEPRAITSEYSENVPCAVIGEVVRVSIGDDESEGDADSLPTLVTPSQAAGRRWITDDGRFVVFRSDATGMVAGDVNGSRDVFVRDRDAESTVLASAFSGGAPSDGGSFYGAGDQCSISADGRYVVFQSDETDFDPEAFYELGGGFGSTYRKDLLTGDIVAIGPHVFLDTMELSPGAANDCVLSADGSIAVFVSNTNSYLGLDENKEVNDKNGATDVFLTVVGSRVHTRISESTAGDEGTAPAGQGAAACRSPRVSADGGIVAFISYLDDLVSGLPTGTTKEYAFVRDTGAGTTFLGSVTSAGGPARATEIALSDDGDHLAFASFEDGIVPEDTDGKTDIFVRNLTAGTTELASIPPEGQSFTGVIDQPAISGDGRFVLFRHRKSTFVTHLYIRDRLKGTTELLSIGSGGEGDGISTTPDISPDGRYVVFGSNATNLVEDDANFKYDVFLLDRGPQEE